MFSPRRLAAALALSAATTIFAPALAVAAQVVHVDLTETRDGRMTVLTSLARVKAGAIAFQVANKSKDIEHEFLIARLTTAPSRLPFDEAKGIVKEDALADLHELGDLAPGATGTLTLDLTAGKYILFCNLPGHFKAGMRHILTVAP